MFHPNGIPILLYTGPAGSIQCYCDERPGLPSPECLLPHEYRCNSTRGCYLRRWYSEQFGRIKQSWGCIEGQHGTGAQFDLWEVYCGALNTSKEVYKCCNSSDFCNRQLSITLEIEGQEPVLPPTPSLTLTEPHISRGEAALMLYMQYLCFIDQFKNLKKPNVEKIFKLSLEPQNCMVYLCYSY